MDEYLRFSQQTRENSKKSFVIYSLLLLQTMLLWCLYCQLFVNSMIRKRVKIKQNY